jgi:hypothetical protein
MMPRYKEFEVMFNPYVEKGEFPPDFIEKFRKLPIQGCISGEEGAKYGGIGCNLLEGYAICFDAGKF